MRTTNFKFTLNFKQTLSRTMCLCLTLLLGFFSILNRASATSSATREGISSTISAETLKGLEDWLNQTKMDLEREFKRISKLDLLEQEKEYSLAIDKTLITSKDDIEFLSRNILYRAQEIEALLLTVPYEPKRNAFARRFLKQSVAWAISLAPLDADAIQKGKVLELPGSPERLKLGVEWAREMVNLSFSLPTSESHSLFLQKVMGFLYNDILQDDRYNRVLANTARQFAKRHAEIESRQPKTPIEHLENAKMIREFLTDEIKMALESIKLQPNGINQTLISLTNNKVLNPNAKNESDEKAAIARMNECVANAAQLDNIGYARLSGFQYCFYQDARSLTFESCNQVGSSIYKLNSFHGYLSFRDEYLNYCFFKGIESYTPHDCLENYKTNNIHDNPQHNICFVKYTKNLSTEECFKAADEYMDADDRGLAKDKCFKRDFNLLPNFGECIKFANMLNNSSEYKTMCFDKYQKGLTPKFKE